MIDMRTMAPSLVATRKKMGMYQKDVATKANVSIRTVQRVESGEGGHGSCDDLQRILDVIGWNIRVEYGYEVFVGAVDEEEQIIQILGTEVNNYV